MDLLLEKLIIIDAIAFGEIWHFIKANKSKSPAFWWGWAFGGLWGVVDYTTTFTILFGTTITFF